MILDLLKAIIFGIVEGITEWLPISSTGHLILVEQFLKFTEVREEFWKMFQVVIQLGAILAVVLIYFKNHNTNSVKFDNLPNETKRLIL